MKNLLLLLGLSSSLAIAGTLKITVDQGITTKSLDVLPSGLITPPPATLYHLFSLEKGDIELQGPGSRTFDSSKSQYEGNLNFAYIEIFDREATYTNRCWYSGLYEIHDKGKKSEYGTPATVPFDNINLHFFDSTSEIGKLDCTFDRT